MPIPSLYKKIPVGYVKANLPKDCFLGIEHGKTLGVAHAVCKNVVQVWNEEWDLYFPPSEHNRIFAGRDRVSKQRLVNILEEEAAAEAALLEEEEEKDNETLA